VVPYDTASVQLLRENHLEIVGGRGFPNLEELLGVTFDPNREDNPNREVVRTQASFIVDDAPTVYEEFLHDPHAPAGIRSWLGVPMLVNERLIGMIALDKSDPGFYTREHTQLAEAFTAQAAIAIENARLYQQAQREISERKRVDQALWQRNRELKLLNRAGQVINSVLDLDQVLVIVLEEVRHLLGAAASSIWLTDPETDEMVCQQAAGPHGETVRGWRLSPGEGIAGWVARHGESLILPDVQADERHFLGVDQRIGLSLHSILSVPLWVKQNVIGALQVLDTEIGRFNREDLTLLELLASSAAIAIENARLFEQARREINERKQAEEALRESEARAKQRQVYLERVLAAAPDAIVTMDPAHQIIEWNPGAERLFGYSREEAIGRDIDHLITKPDVLKEATGFTLMSKNGEETGPVEIIRYRKDGSPVDVILSGSPILEDKELIGTIAVYTDNAERKRVEKERAQFLAQIQEQAQRVQKIVDTVPEGVLLLDADGCVILANPLGEKDLITLAGAKVGDLLSHLGDRPLNELLTSPPKGLWHKVTTDRRNFQVIARPLETGTGAGSWILVIRDVTRQVEVERRIQQQERLASVGQLLFFTLR
jgi:PAS domain S-box-containing protein